MGSRGERKGNSLAEKAACRHTAGYHQFVKYSFDAGRAAGNGWSTCLDGGRIFYG